MKNKIDKVERENTKTMHGLEERTTKKVPILEIVTVDDGIIQYNIGESWKEIIKGKAVSSKDTGYNPKGQRETQLRRDNFNGSEDGERPRADLNTRGKSHQQCKYQISSYDNAISYRSSCSNSFGVLEEASKTSDIPMHNETKGNEDGRKSRNANLPKLLKNNYVMEY